MEDRSVVSGENLSWYQGLLFALRPVALAAFMILPARRHPQAWLMGRDVRGGGRGGSASPPRQLFLCGVSQTGALSCAHLNRTAGSEFSQRKPQDLPSCASVSLPEEEAKPTGLSDSAVPRRAKRKGGLQDQTPFLSSSWFVFEQTLGQPIRTKNPGFCIPWLTASAGSGPVELGSPG